MCVCVFVRTFLMFTKSPRTEISADGIKGGGTGSNIMIHCSGRKHNVTFEDYVRQTMHKSHLKSLKHPSFGNRCVLQHLQALWLQDYAYCLEATNTDVWTDVGKEFCKFHISNRLSKYNLNICRKENPYMFCMRLRRQIQKKIYSVVLQSV